MLGLENEVIGGLLVVGSAFVIVLSLLPKVVTGLGFAGFREELIQQPHQTTTRQRDGVEAYDFWHYPLIDLTPDVGGDFTVTWRYVNSVDGSVAYDSGDIVNVFSLVGGVVQRLELRDTRLGDPGGVPGPRDTLRGESIAYGDPDGLLDGAWHRITSNVSVSVTSPSGNVASTSGLLDETFMSVRRLAVTFAGFNVVRT